MSAGAVLYVGDLGRMRTFYERCFGLVIADEGTGFCGLQSPEWLLTLVHSAQAMPANAPAPRRSQTPIKLTIDVDSIAAVRPTVADLGGQVDPQSSEWSFRNATLCDCVDPEGNVVQLIQANRD